MNPRAYALWIILNAICFGLILGFLSNSWIGWAAVVFLFAHAGIIWAAIKVIAEETSYLDGEIEYDERIFMRKRLWSPKERLRESCIRKPSLLAFSSLMLLLLTALLLFRIDNYSYPQLKDPPIFSVQYLGYLVVCLHEMPGIKEIARAADYYIFKYNYHAAWLPEARIFPFLLYLGTGAWIYSAFRIVVEQRNDGFELLRAFERAHSLGNQRTEQYLQMRLERAPGFMSRRMLRAGLLHSDLTLRPNFIVIFYNRKMLTFPRTLVHTLQSQPTGIKRLGLHYASLSIEQEAQQYEPELRKRIISTICWQIRENNHETDVVLELWKLARIASSALDPGDKVTPHDQMAQVAAERIDGVNYADSQKALIDLALADQLRNFPQKFLRAFSGHTHNIKIHGVRSIVKAVSAGDWDFNKRRTADALRSIRLNARRNKKVKVDLQDLKKLLA